MAIIALLFAGTFAVSFIFSEGEYDIYAFSTGSPGGRTDSPGDMSNCFACHTGTFNSGNANVVISSNDLVNGYVPGQTYNIQLDVNNTNAAKLGFEVTAEKDTDNSKVGTLLLNDANQTQFVNSNAAITHTQLPGQFLIQMLKIGRLVGQLQMLLRATLPFMLLLIVPTEMVPLQVMKFILFHIPFQKTLLQ